MPYAGTRISSGCMHAKSLFVNKESFIFYIFWKKTIPIIKNLINKRIIPIIYQCNIPYGRNTRNLQIIWAWSCIKSFKSILVINAYLLEFYLILQRRKIKWKLVIGALIFPKFKKHVQAQLGSRSGLGNPTSLWGSRWPSGQNCKNALINIMDNCLKLAVGQPDIGFKKCKFII